MSEPASEPKLTTAGIVQDPASQQRVIPQSRRPDGSIRKERKVRPGFTPAEDVARFRPSRVREAEQLRQRGIPGSTSSAIPSASDFPALSSPASSPGRPSPSSARPAPPVKVLSSAPRRQVPLDTAEGTQSTATDVKSSEHLKDANSPVKKSWPASKLRKPISEKPTAQVQVSDKKDVQRDADTQAGKELKRDPEQSAAANSRNVADDLAKEMGSLRLDKGESRLADDKST